MDWASITWDTARAGGLVAYLLLSVSVCLGLALANGWRSSGWPRFMTNDLHQQLTLLAIAFVGVHSIAVLLDPFMKFTPGEVLVPLASHYRPYWVALGIVAAYLTIALWLSEQARRWIGYAWWRRLHYATFAAYLLVTVHGLASGSDSDTWWAFAIYGGSTAAVATLLSARIFAARPSGVRTGAGVATAGAMLGIWAFAVLGPLQPGWNSIANLGRGSGSRLVAAAAPSASPSPSPSASAAGPARAFQAPFSGSEQVSNADAGARLVISGDLQGRPGDRLRAELSGRVAGGQFLVQSGRLLYQPAGGSEYSGAIDSVQGAQLSGRLSNGAAALDLVFVITGYDGSGGVSGMVSARPAG
jgi:DMSO/TMAO reductase YedYZ heme-binding membrane subunit